MLPLKHLYPLSKRSIELDLPAFPKRTPSGPPNKAKPIVATSPIEFTICSPELSAGISGTKVSLPLPDTIYLGVTVSFSVKRLITLFAILETADLTSLIAAPVNSAGLKYAS